MSRPADATQILTLVQAYCDAHDTADDQLQQAVWNLTKARRSSRSFAAALPSTDFSASSIRHELSARTRVVRDDDSVFRAVDPKAAPELQDVATNVQDYPLLVPEDSVLSSGVRQRKGKVEATSTTTMIMEHISTESSSSPTIPTASEEALLILAGSLPPRELRIAQEKARRSLDSYIQAATLMAALQQRLGES